MRPIQPERGHADRSHHLHQPRPARAPAVRQRGRRFRTGRQRADQAHRGADEAHRSLAAADSQRWRSGSLISHLSLNYLSLVEGGRTALQQILRLYNFTESPFAEKMIEGIIGAGEQAAFRAGGFGERHHVRARHAGRIGTRRRAVRGRRRVPVCQRDRAFSGAVRSLNSFSQLTAKTRQRKEVLQGMAAASGTEDLAVDSAAPPAIPALAPMGEVEDLLRRIPAASTSSRPCGC